MDRMKNKRNKSKSNEIIVKNKNINKSLEIRESISDKYIEDIEDNKINANNGRIGFQQKFKRNRFRDKCFAKRQEKGIILLSPNIEKKIYNLKKALRSKGLAAEEIKQIVRKRRRHEENKYNRDMSKGCFKCRQMGHKLVDCPLVSNDCEEGVDVCYRCGSSEHNLSDCSQKSNGLPFAKCFLCSQTGHLTRTCPLNKRGIYPKGGNCKKCGSVNHLIKDCPQNSEQGFNFFIFISKFFSPIIFEID
jgi:zinc finger CCHC domain-containing protein 9